MSFLFSSIKLIPFTPFRILSACTSPEACEEGKVYLGHITRYNHFGIHTHTGEKHFDLLGSGILCFIEYYTASFRVRPRMKARGAIWMIFSSIYSFSLAAGIMFAGHHRAVADTGQSCLSCRPEGSQVFLPGSTAGWLSMIFFISLFFKARTARAMAV